MTKGNKIISARKLEKYPVLYQVSGCKEDNIKYNCSNHVDKKKGDRWKLIKTKFDQAGNRTCHKSKIAHYCANVGKHISRSMNENNVITQEALDTHINNAKILQQAFASNKKFEKPFVNHHAKPMYSNLNQNPSLVTIKSNPNVMGSVSNVSNVSLNKNIESRIFNKKIGIDESDSDDDSENEESDDENTEKNKHDVNKFYEKQTNKIKVTSYLAFFLIGVIIVLLGIAMILLISKK